VKPAQVATAGLPAAGLVLWTLVIAGPLAVLLAAALGARPVSVSVFVPVDMPGSFASAAGIAAVAVLLGWFPGRLLAAASRAAPVLLLLLLLPLILPQYLLYYAWQMLLSPTTSLGAYLSGRPAAARAVSTATTWFVLATWCWSLAALILSQAWRNIDRAVWDMAALDARPLRRFLCVTLPLLGRGLLLAWGCCFVLILSEFGTFHLAGIRTFGTELAVLYQLTGSSAAVAAAAWPVAVVAAVVAVAATAMHRQWFRTARPACGAVEPRRLDWMVVAAMVGLTCGAPVAILAMGLEGTQGFRRFGRLHVDELLYSLLIGCLTAAVAHLIGWTALALADPDDRGHPRHESPIRWRGGLILAVRCTILAAMFLPGSLMAAGLLQVLAIGGAPDCLRNGWPVVAMGQGARFAGLAMIVFMLTRYPDRRRLSEMAAIDGAGPWRTWWFVHAPRVWPVLLGGFLLVVALSLTELSATMVLLPPGLPNFAQRLLNQMHYARDQQVIASCLILIAALMALCIGVVLLLAVVRRRWSTACVVLLLALATGAGCRRHPGAGPDVVRSFGRTGSGAGEFLYPRAIDYEPGGHVLVVDKTGRIQRLTETGQPEASIQMPLIEAGYPTGLKLGPDSRLYVADTHYHRVLILSAAGQIVGEFGSFGRDDGCFIYPTDVEHGPDGRLYVSEYGGNDRVSVFNADGGFLFSFGSPGAGPGQFSRPSALCIDADRQALYVADACNHRIGVYDLEGRLQSYIGEPGRAPGQLRYPYDLALLGGSTSPELVVCEYGNNRIQVFDSTGRSVAVYGKAGRGLGQLAYPWGVAVGPKRQVFIVDAGNNRIQVWRLRESLVVSR